MKGIKINDQVRQAVIQAYQKGMTKKAIADQFSISPTSVRRIVRDKAPTPEGVTKNDPTQQSERLKRIEALEKRVLALEKKILSAKA